MMDIGFRLIFFIGITFIQAELLYGVLPNVILVMADDLGIGDVTPTNSNSKIKTPHLERMANEGMTFLDAHSPSSVCTPTRYGLVTGRYCWRTRIARGVLSGRSEHLIPKDYFTYNFNDDPYLEILQYKLVGSQYEGGRTHHHAVRRSVTSGSSTTRARALSAPAATRYGQDGIPSEP